MEVPTAGMLAESVEKTVFLQAAPAPVVEQMPSVAVPALIEQAPAMVALDISHLILWGGFWLTSVSAMITIFTAFAVVIGLIKYNEYNRWRKEIHETTHETAQKTAREEAAAFLKGWTNKPQTTWKPKTTWFQKNTPKTTWSPENKGEKND